MAPHQGYEATASATAAMAAAATTPLLSRSHSPSTPTSADQARKDWRRHGQGLSQLSEEKRKPQTSHDVVVRIMASGERQDITGNPFTAYLISVSTPSERNVIVEHRYSEFAKLNSVLKKHEIVVETPFPSKHWAGRVGNWTPSMKWAPNQHQDLIGFRKTQLDLWLVDLVGLYNRQVLPEEVQDEVQLFLSNTTIHPCDRDNDIDLNNTIERGLRWLNPLSFTLGSAIRQASLTLKYMCGGLLTDSDKSIPLDLLHHARALCFMTTVKAGLVLSGKVGTGLVICRRPNMSWSAPSAMGTIGVGWGAQIGGDITHYLIVLTNDDAVEQLCRAASVTLGAELNVAAGPIGRGANSHISSGSLLQPAYAYAHSHGLFVGMSLEGGVFRSRPDVNANFYGRNIDVREILAYQPQPRAALPLYEALLEAHEQDVPKDGLRPSLMMDQVCGKPPMMPLESPSSDAGSTFYTSETMSQAYTSLAEETAASVRGEGYISPESRTYSQDSASVDHATVSRMSRGDSTSLFADLR